MTIARKFTAVATAAAIAIGSLGTLTTAAEAGPRHGGYGGGKHYSHGGPGYGHGHYNRGRGYGHNHHRHYRKKDNTGKYIAIGAAALMLGVIASEASRR
ncbi:hypothetical protein [Hyphomicrobium sulfonivorans]|uniref:hypothetical protein n=1 Tax=Hyphomicrobium sulfonivorans TaxID=121290 RepID=UPI00156EB61E|nr:hypothetical protein [Hyphomicrobium sulfonivorans]MBI1648429.1 hypothetical protein [Hyphomicrobium sulfonivorans]NSL71035.1 hypothetical protein [Hyphomicrobium sulfonivorans]